MADKYRYDWSGKVGDYLVKAPARGIVFGGAQAANWLMGRLPYVPKEVEQNNARDIQKWADVMLPYRTNNGEGNIALKAEEFVSGMAGGRNAVRFLRGGLGLTKQAIVKTATAAARKSPVSLKPPPIVRPGKVTTDAARKATVEAHEAFQKAIGTSGEQAARDAWQAAAQAESTVLSATSFVKKAKAAYDWTAAQIGRVGPWVSRPATKLGEMIAASSPVVLGAPYSTALAFLGDNLIPGVIAQAGRNNAASGEEKAVAEANAKADEAMKNTPAYLLRNITGSLSKDSDATKVSEAVAKYRDFRKGVAADKTAEFDKEFLKSARGSAGYMEVATNAVNESFLERDSRFYGKRLAEYMTTGMSEDDARKALGPQLNSELIGLVAQGKDTNAGRQAGYNKYRESVLGTADKPLDPGNFLINGGK